MKLSPSLETALKELRRGNMVILTDNKNRENEADLVCAATETTQRELTFMAKYASGLICVALTAERAFQLELMPMVDHNTSRWQCHFTVPVDAKRGTGTGISAYDRAATIRALLRPASRPEDFRRPGHVFPLVGEEGGVLTRAGHTEGALDLMRLAGLKPMAVICEIMGNNGKMLTGKKLRDFAHRHGFPLITIQSIIEYRKNMEKQDTKKKLPLVHRAVETTIPTPYGTFRMIVYRTNVDAKEHIALIKGTIKTSEPILTRVHSECLTGDVFHTSRCDCAFQLDQALRLIAATDQGIFLYMRQEGRGVGLVNKLRSYNLQDRGYDTVSAQKKLGLPIDTRQYSVGAAILLDLGAPIIRLMTNNPRKIADLKRYGIAVVERVPLESTPHGTRGRRYLAIKKLKLGHLISKV